MVQELKIAVLTSTDLFKLVFLEQIRMLFKNDINIYNYWLFKKNSLDFLIIN